MEEGEQGKNEMEVQNEELAQRRKEDEKAIFIENVDYQTKKQELELIFEDCGTIANVVILKDKFTKMPRGCAYLFFTEREAVEKALYLTGTRLRNRAIKVKKKRTNIAGMSSGVDNAQTRIFAEITKRMYSMQRRGGR